MPFLFLALPGEIRNQILRLLLTHKTPIIARSVNHLAPPRPTSLEICPNTLLTCWQVYNESLSFLYGENTFQAHPSYLTAVLFAMDPTRLVTAPFCVEMVRRFHIRVRLDCDPYYHPAAVAKAFNSAEELEVECFRSSWGIGGYDALEGFMSVRGVHRASVHGSVGMKMALWLKKVMQSPEGSALEECEGDEELGWVGHKEVGSQWPWGQDR